MSKTATARTNRIRARMNRARAVAHASGSGVHARKVYAIRPKAVVEKQATQ